MTDRIEKHYFVTVEAETDVISEGIRIISDLRDQVERTEQLSPLQGWAEPGGVESSERTMIRTSLGDSRVPLSKALRAFGSARITIEDAVCSPSGTARA